MDPRHVNTLIEYIFDDNTKIQVNVDHFEPRSVPEMDASIKSRGISEWIRVKSVRDTQSAATILDQYIGQVNQFTQT